MAPKEKSNITIAVIGAIASIAVAIVTTYGTIYVSKPEAQKVKQELINISEVQRIQNLPIGTIIPSMLPPALFSDQVKDVVPFNALKTNWVLADGETDITLSRYGKLFGNKRYPPNLRGMFLRGMNEGRNDGKEDPEKNRNAGDDQLDMVVSHIHEYAVQTRGGNIAPSKNTYNVGLMSDGNGYTFFNKTNKNDTDKMYPETRPKNVSVYFYIKIN